MSVLMCLMVPGLMLLSGHLLLSRAQAWMRATGLPLVPVMKWRRTMLLYWMLVSHAILLAGWYGMLSTPEVVRGLLLCGWCLMLAALDITGYWMPLGFTAPAGLSGLLFSLWVLPERSPGRLITESALTFIFLYLMRRISGGRQERLGLGDVFLITALVLWFPLKLVTCTLMLAVVLALVVSAGYRLRVLPFGLFLCPAASLLPFMPALTQGYL